MCNCYPVYSNNMCNTRGSVGIEALVRYRMYSKCASSGSRACSWMHFCEAACTPVLVLEHWKSYSVIKSSHILPDPCIPDLWINYASTIEIFSVCLWTFYIFIWIINNRNTKHYIWVDRCLVFKYDLKILVFSPVCNNVNKYHIQGNKIALRIYRMRKKSQTCTDY